jgi:small subunit ribosomal protein S6
MRRYELMLVLRPDVPDDRSQALIDRTTRQIVSGGGQIVKVAPWGRRRLAYPIDRHREGSYHIVVFEAPAPVLGELERGLLITEEVLRHLVTRIERPVRAVRRDGAGEDGLAEDGADDMAPPVVADVGDAEDADTGDLDAEAIDESETEAAPAAIE